MGFFSERRSRKAAHEVLRQARYLRNMTGDLLAPSELEKLTALENDLKQQIRQKDTAILDQASSRLSSLVLHLMPSKDHVVLRENLEVIVVAIMVAMAVRTYFLQPFKIPTGSMQPTLYGITAWPVARPHWTDRMPIKLGKWAVTGIWYTELRAKSSGYLGVVDPLIQNASAQPMIQIGNVPHVVPRDASLRYHFGEYVSKGSLLWSGMVKAGDHVFVDKVSWNFRRPRRGEIMVFKTDGIPMDPPLAPGTHYIKRMAGLPNERIQIDPPYLVVDGVRHLETPQIRRIAERQPGYDAGYLCTRHDGILPGPGAWIDLAAGQYFALGDNTTSSKDGRYWGFVPEANLVGPAILVYWPFSPRWGLAD